MNEVDKAALAARAMAAALRDFLVTPGLADERARNIAMALATWNIADRDETPYSTIADMLWSIKPRVPTIVPATRACLRAWILSQVELHERLSLLQDIGFTDAAAEQLLDKLGLFDVERPRAEAAE